MSQPVTNSATSSWKFKLYQNDFEITGEDLMEIFLWTEVKQPGKVIKLHLDSYIQVVLNESEGLRGVHQEITSAIACSDVSWTSP
jgi:hypothetical protein